MNLSASFILPLLKLNCSIYKNGLINTYMGDADYNSDWGDLFFVVMEYDSRFLHCLRSNAHFIDEYPRAEGQITFVFDVSSFKTVIKPFLDGKYSKIDRAYVIRNFPHIEGNRRSLNREILEKSQRVRQYQEDRIGVTLPPDAEVWDKPTKKLEIYNYVDTPTSVG